MLALQAKQIRRKMIEQDLVRVRAMQLCREAGQEPQVDSQADDGEGGREGGREGGSKRSGSDAKSHSERLQRKLAAKKEALGRSDAAGFDSAERAERFLQTLPGEQREEALRLPLERLQEVFAQVAHAQAEQLAGESGGQAALCDTVPCLIAAADERAQGQWIARSWVNGDFQRFTNRQEYASTLLTMVWRLLLQKCKGDVLARWHHAPEPPEEGKEERWRCRRPMAPAGRLGSGATRRRPNCGWVVRAER